MSPIKVIAASLFSLWLISVPEVQAVGKVKRNPQPPVRITAYQDTLRIHGAGINTESHTVVLGRQSGTDGIHVLARGAKGKNNQWIASAPVRLDFGGRTARVALSGDSLSIAGIESTPIIAKNIEIGFQAEAGGTGGGNTKRGTGSGTTEGPGGGGSERDKLFKQNTSRHGHIPHAHLCISSPSDPCQCESDKQKPECKIKSSDNSIPTVKLHVYCEIAKCTSNDTHLHLKVKKVDSEKQSNSEKALLHLPG
jgi:hypothetical protein